MPIVPSFHTHRATLTSDVELHHLAAVPGLVGNLLLHLRLALLDVLERQHLRMLLLQALSRPSGSPQKRSETPVEIPIPGKENHTS